MDEKFNQTIYIKLGDSFRKLNLLNDALTIYNKAITIFKEMVDPEIFASKAMVLFDLK